MTTVVLAVCGKHFVNGLTECVFVGSLVPRRELGDLIERKSGNACIDVDSVCSSDCTKR